STIWVPPRRSSPRRTGTVAATNTARATTANAKNALIRLELFAVELFTGASSGTPRPERSARRGRGGKNGDSQALVVDGGARPRSDGTYAATSGPCPATGAGRTGPCGTRGV